MTYWTLSYRKEKGKMKKKKYYNVAGSFTNEMHDREVTIRQPP